MTCNAGTETTGPVVRTTLSDLRIGAGRTARFDGADFGAGASFFMVEADPGTGPSLHVHEYSETWAVLAGAGRFSAAGAEHDAIPGDVLVVPPRTPHRFVSAGHAPLQMVCIHASPRIEQEFVRPREGNQGN